jgi:hypothetical protein
MLGVSLWTNLYMTWEDHVFVVDVVVTDLTWETMASSAINRPTCVVMKLNTIAKICKYTWLHEKHHFISMAMEVHDAPGCDMNCFIKECVCLFHDKWLRGQLSLSFLHSIF